MKKIVVVCFLIIMGAYGGVSSNKLLEQDCLNIKVILNECVNGAVKNGNSYIIDVDKLNEYKNFEGITLYFKPDWDYEEKLIKQFVPLKIKTYFIDNYLIIEGQLKNLNIKNGSFQLAISNDEIVLGFPSILNGF